MPTTATKLVAYWKLCNPGTTKQIIWASRHWVNAPDEVMTAQK